MFIEHRSPKSKIGVEVKFAVFVGVLEICAN